MMIKLTDDIAVTITTYVGKEGNTMTGCAGVRCSCIKIRCAECNMDKLGIAEEKLSIDDERLKTILIDA